jgi:hypothetical protein
MKHTRIHGVIALAFGCLLSHSALGAPPASADLVKARQLFFGIENVNAATNVRSNARRNEMTRPRAFGSANER